MTDTLQEKTLTANEVLENMLALEQEAKEILPGKFDECTFKLGYIRQKIYACKTCNPPEKELSASAGICYSCSISCHGRHDLVELFDRRNFRCDCGIMRKFGNFKCNLEMKLKEGQTNEKNSYNQNYKNRFCFCNVDYDPEKTEEDMIQCLVCEDWYHESHIGLVPPMDEFDCYICRTCTTRLPFLKCYIHDPKFVFGLSVHSREGRVDHIQSSKLHDAPDVEEETTEHGIIEIININNKRALSTTIGDEGETGTKKARTTRLGNEENSECKRDGVIPPGGTVDLFLRDQWRSGLCSCPNCERLYKDNGVEFLLQEEITYEPEEDEDISVSAYEASLKELGRMPRQPAIEGSIAINGMINKLKEYLNTFKESGKAVAKEDVDRFFAELHQQRVAKKAK